jgi:hypothetical protein
MHACLFYSKLWLLWYLKGLSLHCTNIILIAYPLQLLSVWMSYEYHYLFIILG